MNWLQRLSQAQQPVAKILLDLVRNNIDVQSAIQQLQTLGAQASSAACGMMQELAMAFPESVSVLEQLSQTICQDVQDTSPETDMLDPAPLDANEVIE